MSEVQRWDAVDTMYEVSTGEWVTYADHVAAVAAAEQRVKSDFAKYLRHMVDAILLVILDDYDYGVAREEKS